MRLFINASAANAGGGLTYLRNVIPQLSARPGVKTTVLAAGAHFRELGELPGISLVNREQFGNGAGIRFWREQAVLPQMIRRTGCDVLISAGNIGLFHSPVPQILLARNALYTSSHFYADAWARRNFGLWLGTRIRGLLARWSVLRADRVVTPSEAFAAELRAWMGKRPKIISAIHHGFDAGSFFGGDRTLDDGMKRLLARDGDGVRLLFVSHYNYFRNFDTLLRALPILKSRFSGKRIQLVLTCRLQPAPDWGPYDATGIQELARRLGVADDIVELGLVPYSLLPNIYGACDIYVTPAYAESFAHPLVEAMACGLPVVASDLPVHREVCGEAALYFPRFSPESLSERIAVLAGSRQLAAEVSAHGLRRSKSFSWKKHVDQLLSLAAALVNA